MTDLKSNKKRKGHPQVINPVDEFCLPVSLPTDPEWVAAFIGAIRKLSNRSTWDYDAGGDYIVLADRWAEIADEISLAYQAGITCEAEICEDGSCTQIGAFHPALTYYPNNPITQPDYSGPYQTPIWGTGAGYIGATGSDAMIDVFAYATQNLLDMLTGAILPSITLNFSGSGEIDVQFLSTIQGGAVWGYPDGNPILGDLISLEYTDIFSLAGTATLIEFFELVLQSDAEAFVTTHSFVFETEGPHTLTLLFFPTAELEPPFIGAGGGLRSIQLCGNATVLEDVVTPYTLALDGDSLNLLADDVVVSEISKTTLQSFLDRWIDNAPASGNEVYIGNLDMYPNASSKYRTAVFSGIGSLLEETYISGHNSLRWHAPTANKGLMWTVDTPRIFVSIRNGRFMVVDSGVSGGVAGYLATLRATVSGVVPLLVQNTNGGALMAEFQDATLKRAALSSAGAWLGSAVEGWDYSSTSWRRQFHLYGGWVNSTDATRRALLLLDVSAHDGDYRVMSATVDEVGGEPPLLSFIGGVGSKPRQMVYHGQTSARLDEALLELQKYGFLGDYVAGQEPLPVVAETDLNRCFAAYYVADKLTAAITALFDDMSTVTGVEFVENIADAFNLDGTAAPNIVYEAFQAAYADRVGILAEITDPAVIAEALIEDFSLQGMLDFIDGYAWALGQTPAFLTDLFTQIWEYQVWRWAGRGIVTQYGPCGGPEYVLPCADAIYDFRWQALHGWELNEGVPVLASGIENELNDGDYSVRLYGYFDNCNIKQIHVTYYGAAVSSQMVNVFGATSDGMGGYDQWAIPWQIATSPGENRWTIGIPEGGLYFDRVLVRLSEHPNYYDNSIRKIEIEIEE